MAFGRESSTPAAGPLRSGSRSLTARGTNAISGAAAATTAATPTTTAATAAGLPLLIRGPGKLLGRAGEVVRRNCRARRGLLQVLRDRGGEVVVLRVVRVVVVGAPDLIPEEAR